MFLILSRALSNFFFFFFCIFPAKCLSAWESGEVMVMLSPCNTQAALIAKCHEQKLSAPPLQYKLLPKGKKNGQRLLRIASSNLIGPSYMADTWKLLWQIQHTQQREAYHFAAHSNFPNNFLFSENSICWLVWHWCFLFFFPKSICQFFNKTNTCASYWQRALVFSL